MKNKATKLVLLSLGALSLVSCGGSGDNKIELKIGFWPESTSAQDVAMYNVWKERFEADNPQYVIKASPYTYSTETVGSKYTTNSLPDVWQTWFTEPEKLLKQNIIRPITSQLKELGWDQKMDSEMKESLTFENEIYGVPRDGYGLGLLINKRILGENGLLPEIDSKYSLYNKDGSPAYPTTWEQVYDYSNTIVNENGDAAKGFIMYSANKNGGWVFSNMAWNYGATLEKEESGKIKATLDCQEAVNALEWIKRMSVDGLLIEKISCVYNDWYSNINEKVAMAIVGSDVLQQAALQGSCDMGDLAFVPMPTGDGTHHYSLYGGTPFVFTKKVSDEKVEGILKFFDYIGRSPSTSETNLLAKKEGYEVAKKKGQPILPSIMPWSNEDYVEKAKQLENEYINVQMEDYSPFFSSIQQNKHPEVPYNAQDMYKALDAAIQGVFSFKESASCQALLSTASQTLQKALDKSFNR
ncbi:MAG TPA: hypothetical protein DEA63_05285 [Firmicutes bacterium]|nr:hypothetical protein [Bacillota bacterium]